MKQWLNSSNSEVRLISPFSAEAFYKTILSVSTSTNCSEMFIAFEYPVVCFYVSQLQSYNRHTLVVDPYEDGWNEILIKRKKVIELEKKVDYHELPPMVPSPTNAILLTYCHLGRISKTVWPSCYFCISEGIVTRTQSSRTQRFLGVILKDLCPNGI